MPFSPLHSGLVTAILLGCLSAAGWGDLHAEPIPAEDFSGGESEETESDSGAADLIYRNAAEAHLRFLDQNEATDGFISAAACAACHPDHYREWSASSHAYAQISPVFNTMQAAILEKTAGTNGDFCIRCHTPVGMDRNEELFTSNFKRHPVSTEGVTCVVCHRIDRDYGKVSGRRGIVKGDLFDPVYGPTGNHILQSLLKTDPNLKPSEESEGQTRIHGDAVKFDPISTSGFCASCHDVNLPNGFRLEEAFSQFKNSPAAKKGQSCQDCHMGRVPGAVVAEGDANYFHEPAARIGGALWAEEGDEDYGKPSPARKRTSHHFSGPDYSIVHPGIFPHSSAIREHLWTWQRQSLDGDAVVVEERAGLEHTLEFRWQDGWGDPSSAFEQRVNRDPSLESNLPWPWNDYGYRLEFRLLLNDQFRSLNEADQRRHEVLRRGLHLGDFEVTRNDERGLHFRVDVESGTDGHGVPTGFDAERLFFLEVTVEDAAGRILYMSGDRDPNGDVRDLHSAFVHHRAEKTGAWLAASDWKAAVGLERMKDDLRWEFDPDLFTLQSRFLTRNLRGGEREQVLSVNQSIDPLPYVRPESRPSGLYARPAGVRKQAGLIPPNGSREAAYRIDADRLTGERPYRVRLRFIAQMVPVNLIKEIGYLGFDYNLSAKEIAARVVDGHRVSSSTSSAARRGGALTLWDRSVVIDGSRTAWDLRPSENEIMATVSPPFPFDPELGATSSDAAGGIITDRRIERRRGKAGKEKPAATDR